MSPSERENRKRRAAPVRSANGRREPARPERPLPKRGKPAWVRPEYRRRARLRNKLIAGLLAVAVVLVVLLLANSTVLRSNGAVVLARRELWQVIRGLKGKMTIILTTHYMEEAEALADKVAIMKDGRLLTCDSVEAIKERADTNNFEEAFVRIVKGEAK